MGCYESDVFTKNLLRDDVGDDDEASQSIILGIS